MLGFLRNRKAIRGARAKIGAELHRQIRDAIHQDERTSTEKMSTAFVVGYIYWFVRASFDYQGIDGGTVVDKQLRLICDGVIPKKLYAIFQRQLAALELAKNMRNQDSPILGTNVSPAQVIKLFETGTEVGIFDAMSLLAKPNNLQLYLLDQALEYKS